MKQTPWLPYLLLALSTSDAWPASVLVLRPNHLASSFVTAIVSKDGRPLSDTPGVYVTAVLRSADRRICQFALNDRGEDGDAVAGDGVWSKQLSFTLPAGHYYWDFKAQIPGGVEAYAVSNQPFAVSPHPSAETRPRPPLLGVRAWVVLLVLLLVFLLALLHFACAYALRIRRERGTTMGAGTTADTDDGDLWPRVFDAARQVEQAYPELRDTLNDAFDERTQLLRGANRLKSEVQHLVNTYRGAEANADVMESLLDRLSLLSEK